MTPALAASSNPAHIDIRLHPKQSRVFQSEANEILYGGAAGGGKSHLIRALLIALCVAVPGLQCYLFRRTYPELVSSHLEGSGSFLELLAPWIECGAAKVNTSSLDIVFPSLGSAIHLRHCQYETDLPKYQSAEIHVLALDEATHFSEPMYRFLRGRVRLGGLKVPEAYKGRLPMVLAASNPGGVGHNWVKAAWIDPAPEGAVWRAPASEGGMLRQFIAARLEDNPTLTENDPLYEQRLDGLGSPDLVKAMRLGSWEIVAGGALDDVWSPERHAIRPFQIPKGWRLDRSFDWGSSKPYAVVWWAEADGTEAEIEFGVRRAYPKGTLFAFAELYGWNGKANEGCRATSAEIARNVLDAELMMGLRGRVNPGPADSAIFAVEDGRSIADEMARVGVRWEESEKGPGSRVAGLQHVRARLKAGLTWPMEEPGLFFFDTCRHLIRTLPTLPRDPRKPEDVDTQSEDHAFDAVRYRLLTATREFSYAGLRI